MNWRKLTVHSGCWVLFIVYEVGISWYFGDQSTFIEFAVFYVLDIALFYYNAHIVFSRFTTTFSLARIITLTAVVLTELSVYIYFSLIFNNIFNSVQGVRILGIRSVSVIIMAIWRGVYFLGLSIAYWAVIKTIMTVKAAEEAKLKELKSVSEKEKLEHDLAKLQNAFLQARINPHFLFNTLNFILSQVEEGNPDAPGNILLLSEIMQYSLCSLQTDGKVPLSQEIEHIRRYIQLNKSRFDNRLYLRDQLAEISEESIRIPPLLLLTFIENVFKHGDMTDEATPGTIQICFQEGRLFLFTRNRKSKSENNRKEKLGINNAMTRLNNFYETENVDLKIKETETEFILSLKIQLWN